MTVQEALTKKFGDEVNVNVREAEGALVLSVTFINSALNQKTPADRAKRAQDAAQIVKTNYKRISAVRAIWVGFMRRRTRYLVFHHAEILEFYGFDNDARPMEQPDSNSSGYAPQTTANYLSDSDESDVFAQGILLEGKPGGLGITLLPHFKARGDFSAGKTKPPREVSIDIASYAEKPRFDDTVPIVFIVDGKPVVQTKGEFTGNNAQFCYLKFTYPEFRRMIAGNNLTVKMGAREFKLTPKQFEAMKEMSDYVSE